MKKIVFIFLVLLLTACSFYFVKFDLLEENKGAVILKEYPDSVGQIKTHIYQVYSVEGSYKN